MASTSLQRGFKKLTATIETTQTAVAHGLRKAPDLVIITPKANAVVWMSADPDETNVYLTASVAATPVEIYVAYGE